MKKRPLESGIIEFNMKPLEPYIVNHYCPDCDLSWEVVYTLEPDDELKGRLVAGPENYHDIYCRQCGRDTDPIPSTRR